MMKFKKFLAAAMTGAMMFGSVAMAVPAIGVYAEETAAKTRSDIAIEVNYSSVTVTVTSTAGDSYILLDVLKVKNDKPDGKISGSYSYPLKDGKAVIDLSFLGLTKTCAIQVRGDADGFDLPSAYAVIKGQAKKPSLKYVPKGKSDTDTTISLGNSLGTKDGVIGEENLKDYEFKTVYGTTWENLTKFDLGTASVAGTTLMIRKAAVTTKGSEVLAGAEAKVKIAAAPKAPKIKVDYKKGTVTLPKNTEVKVLYVAAEKGATVQLAEEGTQTAEYTFEVKGTYYAKASGDSTATAVTTENLATYFTLNKETGEIAVVDGVTFYSDAEAATDITNTVKGNLAEYVTATKKTEETPKAEYTFEVKGTYYAKASGDSAATAVTTANLATYFTLNKETGEIAVVDGVTFYSDAEAATDITNTVKGNLAGYVTAIPPKTPEVPASKTKHTETETVEVGDTNVTESPVDVLTRCKIATASQSGILENGFVIAVQTKADYSKKKAASSIAFVPIPAIKTPIVNTAKNGVNLDGGSLTWELSTDNKNYVFTAKDKNFEFAISDTEPDSKAKWTAVTSAKPVNKKVADVEGKKIFIREIGDSKQEKLPSNMISVVVEKANEAPAEPVEVVEPVTGLEAWAKDVVYYEDAKATKEVDKTSTATPAEGTTYYVKVVYTPTKDTTPASGTDYYTANDAKTTFTKATLKDNKFTEGTTYYTRKEKTAESNTPEPAQPVEVVEAVTGLNAWETDVVYYEDAAATQEVDKTSVTTPASGTTYYVKAVYTPTTDKTPVQNTKYYTANADKTVFTEATSLESFTEGTTYYTRTEKTTK